MQIPQELFLLRKTWLQTEKNEAFRVHMRESFCKHYKRKLDAGARWKRHCRAPHEGWIDKRHGAWVTCCEKRWKFRGAFHWFYSKFDWFVAKVEATTGEMHLKWFKNPSSISEAPLSFIISTKALFKLEFSQFRLITFSVHKSEHWRWFCLRLPAGAEAFGSKVWKNFRGFISVVILVFNQEKEIRKGRMKCSEAWG